MSKAYTATGKQVLDPAGQHFADAATPVAALLIVCALEMRKHRPAIDGERVICSRCQNELPHDAHEPCVPRAPRCTKTLDMFGEGSDQREAQMPLRKAG
jgi:hypothetical protein